MTKISMADVRRHFSEDIKLLNPELYAELGIDVAGSPDTDQTVVTRFAFEQLKERLAAEKKGNKYGARKTRIGDLTFDSAKEAARYLVLKEQADRGEIDSLMLQCRINLMEGFTFQGEKVQGINYTADFVYTKDGITYVEDVKSVATARTEAFRIRWRLLQWHYKDHPDVRLVQT